MGLPVLEAEILAHRFAEELTHAQAPYYGVNIIDVNQENWDAFIETCKLSHKGVQTLGGRSHLWSVRDFGERKRLLWVNYYPENVGAMQSKEVYERPEVRDAFAKQVDLVERWDWFVTSEDPAGAPL